MTYLKLFFNNFKVQIITAIVLLVTFLKSYRELNNWAYTHYLFNYEFGFVKRGLIGEIFRQLGTSKSYESIDIISLVLTIIFIIIFLHYLFSRRINNLKFAILALASSATIQHLVYDRSRFDLIIYLLTFVCLYQNKRKYSYIYVTLILTLNLFIHEASFFFITPLILFLNYDYHKSVKILFIQASLILVTTFSISHWGGSEEISFENHLELLRNLYPQVSSDSLSVLYKTGLKDNVSTTLNLGFENKRLIYHLFFLVYLTPHALLMTKFAKKVFLKLHNKVALLLCLSPLALYPIGHDHFRWWSLAFINIFLTLVYFNRSEKDFRKEFDQFINDNARIVYFIIFLSLILGPIKVTSCFFKV